MEPLPTTTSSDVAVLIIAYNGRALLADCLASIFASPDAPPPRHVVVVDNASTDDTWTWLAEHQPAVTRHLSDRNLGFAGGNNFGFEKIRSEMPHIRYVVLLNQDTLVGPNWLRELRSLADAHPESAAVQCKLLFHPETSLFNSAGNRAHYLGFGFVTAYRQEDRGQFDQVREITFPSGAAMLVRAEALVDRSLFDPSYFAYLEDAELGWYFRLTGRQVLLCPKSVVYHRYQFTRNPQTYYRLERNRWQLLLTYYRWPTLLLLLPMLLAMECGLLFYFLRVKAMRQKLRSWDILAELPAVLRFRRQIQRQRKLTDRQLTEPFIPHVDFPEVQNPLLSYVGNPMLRIYWALVRRVLWW